MKPVIKGAGYILAHTPSMVLLNGTTQTTERVVNPDSDYLKQIPSHLRDYETALAYYPNQTYIGNFTPDELAALGDTWVDMKMEGAQRYGKFGEIMPEEEFLLLMQMVDVFDVVLLDSNFVAKYADTVDNHPLYDDSIKARLNRAGHDLAEIERLVNEEHAEPLKIGDTLVGCVKRAHDIDVNLSAHVMHENMVSKASNVLSMLHGLKNAGVDRDEIEYVIDCCEEACGDMNQRGGCNFAKACAEIAGLTNATGSDSRGFCAGPAHAMVEAAALVQAGVYKTVMVSAGGCTAKLGMNGKDHIKKELPILEDMIGGFTVILTQDDGVSPEINLEIVGRHTVGTGSAPQKVLEPLVAAPLKRNGLKITDIDKYSPEMQNPDITKPAGAGDVPLANYKMIGALAVLNKDIEKAQLNDFVKQHGLMGWAPTQGHIPSGVPYIGFARQDIMDGKIKNAMIIGKGSLFLGRMTNLFDGVSFVIQANSGSANEPAASEDEIKRLIADAFRTFAANLQADAE